MNASTIFEPFQVLGVPKDASEAEIRARYLELVKEFPPDRDPDRFREIQAAFEAAKDPLLVARRLVEPPGDVTPSWADAIEQQKANPPALTPSALLSLGNRHRNFGTDIASGEAAAETEAEPEGDPIEKQHFVEQPHE